MSEPWWTKQVSPDWWTNWKAKHEFNVIRERHRPRWHNARIESGVPTGSVPYGKPHKDKNGIECDPLGHDGWSQRCKKCGLPYLIARLDEDPTHGRYYCQICGGRIEVVIYCNKCGEVKVDLNYEPNGELLPLANLPLELHKVAEEKRQNVSTS